MASIKSFRPFTDMKARDVSTATPRCANAGSSRIKTLDHREFKILNSEVEPLNDGPNFALRYKMSRTQNDSFGAISHGKMRPKEGF